MDMPPTGLAASTDRQQATPGQQSGPVIASDFQTFLSMLTVQMRNQDPLNPMNASDFAVQLATFSGVEQQVQTNQLLSSLISRSGLADLGNWVGMEVGTPGAAWFDGQPLALAPEVPADADSAMLVVRNAMGSVIDRRELPVDTRHYSWDGLSSDGHTLPEGQYSFVVESRSGNTINEPTTVTAYQRVEEARLYDGQTVLVLPGGLMIDSAEVTSLRQPRDTDAS